jgi:hypothetical protein
MARPAREGRSSMTRKAIIQLAIVVAPSLSLGSFGLAAT